MSPHTDPGALLKQPQYIIEGIILRRLHEKRIEGYTIETAKEIADALQAASHGTAGDKRSEVRSEDAAKVAADLQELMDVIEAVRGGRGLLRVSGTLGEPSDVGVLGIERFNDLMIRAIDALSPPVKTGGEAETANIEALATRLREAAYFCTQLPDLEKHCREVADELMRGAAQAPLDACVYPHCVGDCRPTQAARNAVIEECAKVVDAEAVFYEGERRRLAPLHTSTDSPYRDELCNVSAKRSALENSAALIRALALPSAQSGGEA